MEDAAFREMVTRHDETIGHVTQSIERLATAVEKTDSKMDKVVDALSQNAMILERIANVDSSNKDSVNRLHQRINGLEVSIKDKEEAMVVRLKVIEGDAEKGSKGYDLLVFTAKALTWAVSISVPILVGLLWLIQHS